MLFVKCCWLKCLLFYHLNGMGPSQPRPLGGFSYILYSLSFISSLFKIPMNEEIMLAIPIVPGYTHGVDGEAAAVRNIGFFKRFIQSHPDRWEKLLVYIHGSIRTDVEIKLNIVGAGLPVAHTCFGSMDVRPYQMYEDFEREFIYAIDNTSGLHLV